MSVAKRTANDSLFVVLAVIDLAIFIWTLVVLAVTTLNAVTGDGRSGVIAVVSAGFLALQIWLIVRGFDSFNRGLIGKARLFALAPALPLILFAIWFGAVFSDLTYYGLEQP